MSIFNGQPWTEAELKLWFPLLYDDQNPFRLALGRSLKEREMNKNEEIAIMCHAINRGICSAIGDHVMPPWDECPETMRKSVLEGVMTHRDNPELAPRQSHERWLEFKVNDGWSWGPKKDYDKKTHPQMLPYDELPAEQRLKDHVFKAVVLVMRGGDLDG